MIALLMTAITALGCHGATRFQPRLRMTNLAASFVLCQFGRSLRQGIVSAVQTPALRSDGIAPCIVGARFTSRLVLFHIVSSLQGPWGREATALTRPNDCGSRAHLQRETFTHSPVNLRLKCGGRSRSDSTARFPQTSQKTVTRRRGGDVRCN